MEERKAIDGYATGVMVCLCAIWALQQIAIKVVVTEVAPVMQIAIRSSVASVLVALWMVIRKERAEWAETWRAGVAVAVLFASEFYVVGEALKLTSAAHTVVFLYTAPIFAALGLHLKLPNERLNLVQWGGIALAFIGIVIAFYEPNAPAEQHRAILGDFLALLGGAGWGATTVTIRATKLSDASASLTLLYQLLGAAVLLAIFAVFTGETHLHVSVLSIGSLLFQGVIVSFASFLVWFGLMRKYLASRLGVLSFLTPMFGVVFGYWLLGETLETNFLIGAAFVLIGIVLVSGSTWLMQTAQNLKTRQG